MFLLFRDPSPGFVTPKSDPAVWVPELMGRARWEMMKWVEEYGYKLVGASWYFCADHGEEKKEA